MSRSILALTLIVIGFLIVGLYRSSYRAKAAEEKIAALEVEISNAQREISLLRIEYEHLTSRAAVETYAREELGMVLPSADQIRTVPAIESQPESGGR